MNDAQLVDAFMAAAMLGLAASVVVTVAGMIRRQTARMAKRPCGETRNIRMAKHPCGQTEARP